MDVSAQLCLAIASRRANIEGLQQAVGRFLRRLGVDEEACWRADLAVREAVANAIVHGNREDPGKQVGIAVEFGDGQLTVRVHDEGDGFAFDGCADPREVSRRLAPHGRGLLLMRHYMDEVVHAPRAGGGTTVTLRVRLPPRRGLPRATLNHEREREA